VRHFAFLRAVNVGGRTVRMEHLRQLLTGLGLDDVETFIASGNVIFRAGRRSASALERTIAAHLGSELGFSVDTFVRTPHEITDALAAAAALREGPADLQYVGFLYREPASPARERLATLNDDGNAFEVVRREIHWLRRGGVQSPYSGSAIEKAIGMPTTVRKVNTIVRMAEQYIP
jgi:uncharacterized protein (DUF1697 family)